MLNLAKFFAAAHLTMLISCSQFHMPFVDLNKVGFFDGKVHIPISSEVSIVTYSFNEVNLLSPWCASKEYKNATGSQLGRPSWCKTEPSAFSTSTD
jgi:hypothetical protein